jgi:MFS family permease
MTGPLRHAPYRRIWLAALVSNLGAWMHEAAGAWLMTTLSPAPLTVALMQTAAALPFFLLAFPAGALADVVDRRRLLLTTQTWMAVAAAALGVLTLMGQVTPALLLGLTFALGVGAAVTAPAWQAMTPELVPRADLASAVARNAATFNLARTAQSATPRPGRETIAVHAPGAFWCHLAHALW